jgi:hypothetical protein
MDADYLHSTVGECLANALAEVSSVRPADPIQFIAQWLLKNRDNERAREREETSRDKPVSHF